MPGCSQISPVTLAARSSSVFTTISKTIFFMRHHKKEPRVDKYGGLGGHIPDRTYICSKFDFYLILSCQVKFVASLRICRASLLQLCCKLKLLSGMMDRPRSINFSEYSIQRNSKSIHFFEYIIRPHYLTEICWSFVVLKPLAMSNSCRDAMN
ncbi:hypothetical protein AVEN_128620-1 [Araneus ventricosus]|uniref:Uncharacterized protein n=1 Tax=Araneus ventricosus TaxID=182803 RepID=A0A4Y2W0V6_ARAVE|nr:hypothetical protein AVEN_128620-1 [Araneus ventricosus]